MSKTVIAVDGAPRPFQGAPYNQAIRTDGLVFCAGQVGLDPDTGDMVEGDVAAQTERAMQNLKGGRRQRLQPGRQDHRVHDGPG